MTIQEGYMPFKGAKTYYRIVNPNGKKTPLLLLHGGPGSTYTYFETLDSLGEADDRPIIMYDQIGGGRSMITGRPELFNATTWIEELIAIRQHLNLETLHILGHSWGGMLAIWYAIENKPDGVQSYILSSTLSSAKLWKEEQHRRIAYLPTHMQEALHQAEKDNDYTSKEYEEALAEFMYRHCKFDITEDSPECLRRKKVRGDEAYLVAWGANEFTPTGTVSDYEFTDSLHEIKEPCLVMNGQRDLCSPYIAKTMYDNLPNAEWELFANSRHAPFVEENEKYLATLKNWLNKQDR